MHWIYAGAVVLTVWGAVSLLIGLRMARDAVEQQQRNLEPWL